MKVAIFGSNGQMGRVLTGLYKSTEPDTSLILLGREIDDKSVLEEKPDVLIDFSHKTALNKVLDLGKKLEIPMILATTGYDEADLDSITEASETLPVFYSANMSLGVYVLKKLVAEAARMIGNDSDIELIEKHHRKKKDSPSGTASILLDSIRSAGVEFEPVHGRIGQHLREDMEIGVHSIRGGTIVGEHSVIFCMDGETLELKHAGESKTLFAKGAMSAAKEIIGKPAGLYGMDDLMKWRSSNE
ncbi:MAG: 4-hydroxy-tetrahydrodipicolinate reductase [Clostridiaceae bacterium]